VAQCVHGGVIQPVSQHVTSENTVKKLS